MAESAPRRHEYCIQRDFARERKHVDHHRDLWRETAAFSATNERDANAAGKPKAMECKYVVASMQHCIDAREYRPVVGRENDRQASDRQEERKPQRLLRSSPISRIVRSEGWPAIATTLAASH